MKPSERLSKESPSPTGMLAWIGFGISCFALLCLSIAFCSPYWIQTWSWSQNPFKNMGLWHVCFNNYMQFKDDSQEIYSACWWVFDTQPKYYKLREWLIPPWFITVQVLTTGSLVVEIVTTVMTGLIFLHCCPLMNHEYLQTYAMFAGGAMMFLASMVLIVVSILFSARVNDRYWMPRPDQNWLTWGFGLMVMSLICAFFAGVLLFKAAWDCYNELLRKEDDYTKQALDMSAGMELSTYPNSDQFALVPPGFLNEPPAYIGSFASKPENGSPGFPRRPPSYYDEQQPSLSPTGASSSIPATADEKVALMAREPDRWDPLKPAAEKSFGRDVLSPIVPVDAPDDNAAYGYEQPRGYDGLKSYDQPSAFGPKSYEQPSAFGPKSYDQPSKYGKSYDRNFERRYSDSSFNEDDDGPLKPERQY